MTKKDITSILNHTVRISNNSTPCGSGTVVKAKNEKYVITAKHCIENIKEENVILEYGKPFKKLVWSNLFSHPTIDFAIFRLDSDQDININSIQITPFSNQEEFELIGYPEGFNSEKYLSRTCRFRQNEDEEDTIIRVDFISSLETNKSSASNNTDNFSGGGIWSKVNNNVALTGIFITHEDSFNTGTFINISHANEILKENSLEELVISSLDDEIDSQLIIINGYKNSLKEAEEWIETFFPQKANEKLLNLKTEIELNQNIEQAEKDNLLAECHFLLGIATTDLGKGFESDEYLLKAHEIKPKEERYLERLPTIYFRENGIEETRKFIKKNLRLFPSNPRLWGFADIFLGETKSPPHLRSNILYKISAFISLGQVSSTSYISLGLLNSFFEQEERNKSLPPSKIGRKEIYYWEALARYIYAKYLTLVPYHRLDNYVEQFEKNDLLDYTIELLKRINNSIRGTEIEGKQNFFLIRIAYFHCQYLLTNEKTHIINLYNELSEPSIVKIVGENIYEYIFCLLNINEIDKVEELINRIDKKYHAHTYLAISQFLLSKEQNERLKEYLLKYVNEIDEITENETSDLFYVTENLYRLNGEIDSILDIIRNKNYKNELIKDLVLIFVLKFTRRYEEELKDLLDKYESNFSSIPYSLKKNIVLEYYYFGDKIRAWELLNSYVNKSEDSLELYLYLKNSYELLNSEIENVAIDGEEIFRLLKNWRENFRSNDELLGYELHLASTVKAYHLVVEIVKSGLQKFPHRLEFIINWIGAIREGHLELTDDLEEIIENRWMSFDFAELNHSIYFAEFCLEIDKKEIGLSIYYKLLRANPKNYFIKQEYFKVFTQYHLHEYKENPTTVIEGCFVKLVANEKVYIEEVNSQNQTPKLFHSILEKKIGETVKFEKEIGNSTFNVSIEGIYNPYLGLYYQIDGEIAEKPLMYDRFDIFNPLLDGSKDLLEQFKEKFGTRGTERQIGLDDTVQKFQKFESGFTGLSKNLGDPVQAYQFITNNKSVFFPILPIFLQRQFNSNISEIEFVLDFSSILLFKNLEEAIKNFTLHKSNKYLVPQAVFDFLNKEIKSIEDSKTSEMSLSITSDKVEIQQTPLEYHQSQQTFYKSILDWINENCEVEHTKNRVDIKLMLNRNDKIRNDEDDIFLIFVDSLLLTDNPKRVLISDDIDIFKKPLIGQGQLLSTEHYIKIFHPNEYSDCVGFMLDKNYRGVTINEQILTTAYNLDPLLNKFDGRFFNIINNSFSNDYNPNPLHLLEVFKFIKNIYDSDKKLVFKKHISQTVLRAIILKRNFTQEGMKLGLNFLNTSFTDFDPIKIYIMEDIRTVLDEINNSKL